MAGVTGIGVFYESAFTGGIVNAPFGLIEAGDYGIDVYDNSTFLGGINNSGTIRSGCISGILVESVSSFAGGVLNVAKIFASGTGIDIYQNSRFVGGVTNLGTISASDDGIDIYETSTFIGNVSNHGIIVSYSDLGLEVYDNNADTTYSGTIANSGSITSYYTGMYVYDFAGSGFTGAITNSGNITASDGYGMYVSRRRRQHRGEVCRDHRQQRRHLSTSRSNRHVRRCRGLCWLYWQHHQLGLDLVGL